MGFMAQNPTKSVDCINNAILFQYLKTKIQEYSQIIYLCTKSLFYYLAKKKKKSLFYSTPFISWNHLSPTVNLATISTSKDQTQWLQLTSTHCLVFGSLFQEKQMLARICKSSNNIGIELMGCCSSSWSRHQHIMYTKPIKQRELGMPSRRASL